MASNFGICLLFLVLALSDLAAAGSVESKKLILEEETKGSGPKSYIFRGYNLYVQQFYSSPITIVCKLPSWYNETAMGKAVVKWDKSESNKLTITPQSEPGDYECEAKNTDGKDLEGWSDTKLFYRKAAATINIADLPRNVIAYNETGFSEPLELQCTAPSGSKLKWYLDGKEITDATKNTKIFEANGTLLIQRPGYKDVGVYMCKSDDKTMAYISIEGAPFFVQKHGKSYDSENKLEGETVSIMHELYGNPLPKLEWKLQSDDDAAIESLTDDYLKGRSGFASRLKFYPTMNVSNGELVVSELTKEDRAYYYSYAANEHGNSEFKTLVRIKGKLDALWPFLGIVAEVIILVAIILIYERRRMKQDREADEAMDQKKPLTSTNSDTVRQRKP